MSALAKVVRLLFAALISVASAGFSIAVAESEKGERPLEICDDAPKDFVKASKYHSPTYLDLLKKSGAQLDAIMGIDRAHPQHEDTVLLPGDYYTSITVKNSMYDPDIVKLCRSNSATHNSFAAAKISIDYVGPKGAITNNWLSEQVLFSFGDPSTTASKRNCVFASMGDRAGPYLLYVGSEDGQREYNLHITAVSGTFNSGVTIANIAKLGLAIAGAIPGAPIIAAPIATLVNTTSPIFDQLVTTSDSRSFQYLAIMPPRRGKVSARTDRDPQTNACAVKQVQPADASSYWVGPHISIRPSKTIQDQHPPKRGPNEINVYQRLSASIILDSKPEGTLLTPDEILSNPALGSSHRCIPGAGSCPKEDFFEKTLGATFEPILDFNGADLGKNDISKNRWFAIFSLCGRIKSTATALGLSPIDALLVRWAMLSRIGGREALNDARFKTGIDQVSNNAAMFAVADVRDICWSKTDETTLAAINETFAATVKPAELKQ